MRGCLDALQSVLDDDPLAACLAWANCVALTVFGIVDAAMEAVK